MFLRIGVFYVLTWLFLMLLGGIQEATGILPPEIGLAQWGPGFAALVTVVLFRKDEIKITFISKDTPPQRYLWTALLPAGVGFLVYLLSTILQIQSTATSGVYTQMILVLIWTPLGALGEEIGWRGYLHKKLDTRLRGLFSAILVGFLWMPIHITFLSQGLLLLIFLAIWFISLSIVLFALVHDTEFSVLAATIFHMAINFINLLIIDVMYEPMFWVINGSVWAFVAFVFVLFNREIFLGLKKA